MGSTCTTLLQSRGAFFGGSTRAFPRKRAARGFAQHSNSRWHQEAADTLPAAALCLYGWLRQGDSGGGEGGGGTELSGWEPHGSSSPITCTKGGRAERSGQQCWERRERMRADSFQC